MEPEQTLDLLTMLPAPPFIATLEHLRIDLGFKTQDEVFKLVKECKQRHAVHIVISTKSSERFVRVDVEGSGPAALGLRRDKRTIRRTGEATSLRDFWR